jgi:hypothetical protein
MCPDAAASLTPPLSRVVTNAERETPGPSYLPAETAQNSPARASYEASDNRKEFRMRRITNGTIVIALLICAAASPASAKVTSRVITVGQDFRIAGQTVKAGTYRFAFDDAKNELTVADRKTREVIARAEARAEASKKGTFPILLLEGESAPLSFAGLSFDGKRVIKTSAAASLDQ